MDVWRREAADGPLRIAMRVSGTALIVAGTGLGIAPGYYPIDLPDVWGDRLAGTLAYVFLAWVPLLGIAAWVVSLLRWRWRAAVQSVGISAVLLLASGLFIAYAPSWRPEQSGQLTVGAAVFGTPTIVGLLVLSASAVCAADVVSRQVPDSRLAWRVRVGGVIGVIAFILVEWVGRGVPWRAGARLGSAGPWVLWPAVMPLVMQQVSMAFSRRRHPKDHFVATAIVGFGIVVSALLGGSGLRDFARTTLTVGGLAFLTTAWIAWGIWQDPKPEDAIDQVFE